MYLTFAARRPPVAFRRAPGAAGRRVEKVQESTFSNPLIVHCA
jgi:hypothetical protein